MGQEIVGCDIGTGFTKAVVLREGECVATARVETLARPAEALEQVLAAIAPEAGIRLSDTASVVVTGWGQAKASGRYRTAPTLKCLARAAVWAEPACRTVLCLGAQQSLAVSVSPQGRVLRYVMNDKCASGAGKFLEVILEALGCSLETSAALARRADKRLSMSTQCAVFAESEVVSLINDGESPANIMAAILDSLSKNILSLCKKVEARDPIVLGGGLANNERIQERLREDLGKAMHVLGPAPDLIAAVGAALLAEDGGTP